MDEATQFLLDEIDTRTMVTLNKGLFDMKEKRDIARNPFVIHVSDVKFKPSCLRRALLDRVFPNIYWSPKGIKTVQFGNVYHETKLTPFHETGFEWNDIYGSIDEYADGVIYDKKTVDKLQYETYHDKIPRAHDKKQVEIYAEMMKAKGFNVVGGVIIYVPFRRDDVRCPFVLNPPNADLELEVIHDRDILQPALDKLKELTEIQKKKDEPENRIPPYVFFPKDMIPPAVYSWLCNFPFCKHNWICFHNEGLFGL